MRTSHSSTNTTPYRAVTAERTTWTTCNWYTGGATMRTMRGPGTGRQRLEPDDEQSSRPVLRGLGLGNEARLPDVFTVRLVPGAGLVHEPALGYCPLSNSAGAQ